ncbi:MAG: histidinol dehydrogenase [Clostridia bacterium]|nr:histidinol dehydrogenase [Clostridia bacterium]
MIKIMKYGQVPNSEIFARDNIAANVEDKVTEIINEVKRDGDAALFRFCEKFDGAKLESLEVSPEEIDEAFAAVEPRFIEVLKRAAENIREFHKRQVRNSFIINECDGIVVGQKVMPIEKAGLYVPGGTAAYPSTVLMDSIPAKIAGCKEIVITTPPNKEGKVNPVILAAAKIAGVDRIFKLGGAQAIAALAYGTQSVPKVDKIVGPGNAFVAEAKKQVFGRVSIDMIAGPSEILVVADRTSNPAFVAADLLSQAEHDKMASAVLVTDSMELAEAVSREIESQLERLIRKDIARASIDNNGKIIVADDIRVAIDIANELAPEHLELCVDNPFDYLDSIKHAGSIFMGKNCPEALGDYLAGPNHTLPTSGTARFSSPLSVDDFVKKSQYTYYTRQALERVAEDVAYFAEKEGLTAHARSATVRFDPEEMEKKA